jgi:hypothetical protein
LIFDRFGEYSDAQSSFEKRIEETIAQSGDHIRFKFDLQFRNILPDMAYFVSQASRDSNPYLSGSSCMFFSRTVIVLNCHAAEISQE